MMAMNDLKHRIEDYATSLAVAPDLRIKALLDEAMTLPTREGNVRQTPLIDQVADLLCPISPGVNTSALTIAEQNELESMWFYTLFSVADMVKLEVIKRWRSSQHKD
jgi:hypothetical protein